MAVFAMLIFLAILSIILHQLRLSLATKRIIIETTDKHKIKPKALKQLPQIPHWTGFLMWWRLTSFLQYIGSKFSICHINFLMLRVAIINDYKLGKELFQNPIFCGKQISEQLNVYSQGQHGVINNDGKDWKQQFRFCQQRLKEFGFGTKSMETFIQNEINELIQNWRGSHGERFSPNKSFYLPVLNSLWVILTGERADEQDKELVPLVFLAFEGFKQSLAFPDVFLLFSKISYKGAVRLQKCIPVFSKIFKMEKSTKDLRAHFQNKIQNRKNAKKTSEAPSNLVDAYLKEMERTTDPNSGFYGVEGGKSPLLTLDMGHFGSSQTMYYVVSTLSVDLYIDLKELRNIKWLDLNLVTIMTDFFLAGGDTTANELAWVMLHLIRNPDIQQKIRDEINNVVGADRRPCLQDKPNCPYTEAFILEVLRFTPISSLSLPHATTEDTSIGEYFIQKGTVVLLNIYNIHHDPQIWGDPQNFRPERFLSSNGETVNNHEAMCAFSMGLRRCIGEQFARDTLFLYASSLCQQFIFSPEQHLKSIPPLRAERSGLYSPDKFYMIANPI